MKLSNKKIKHIRRHASEKTPKAIAKALGISVRDVQIVLKSSANTSTAADKTISALDGILHWGLVIITFLAPLMFLRGIYDFANLPQSVFIQVGVVFLLFVWLIKCFINKKCLIAKSPFNLPILAFVLWTLISLIYAHNKYEGLLLWMHWTASALMFFLVINSSYGRKGIIRLLAAVFFSGLLCAVLGLAQHLFGFSWVPQARPPAATFANKNMAVHFIILTLPLVVGLIVNARQRIWKQLLFLAPIIMTAFLVCAKARAGFLALAAESVFLAALLVRVGKRKIAVGLVTVGLAVTILMSLVAYKNFNISSVELRTAIWRNTFEMIKERPFIGLGLGNHKIFYPLYHREVVTERSFSESVQLSNVHNDYIQAFAELGFVGIFLLGWIGFLLVRVAIKLTSSRYSPEVQYLAIGITVGVIGLLAIAGFSFPFQRAIPPFVLMILTGILCSFYSGDKRRFYAITQRSIVFFACFVVFVGLILLVRFHYLGIKCDRHFLRVTQMEKLKDWQGMISEGEIAYSYNPGRIMILGHMGRAYLEMGKHRKGIEAFRKLTAAYPNQMNAWFNLGLAYDKTGDDKGALEAYGKVLFIKPDYSKAHNNIANIYMKQNNLSKALQELKLAAEFDPENSVIRFNVGIVEVQMRRYQEAARTFENAIRLKPGWDLSQRDILSNSKKEVIEHLSKELELNPGGKDAPHIIKLLDLMGKL